MEYLALVKIGFFAIVLLVIVHYVKFKLESKHRKHRRYRREAAKTLHYLQKKVQPANKIFCLLRNLNPYVFEELLLLAFSEQGFRVEKSQSYSHDGGVDGFIYDRRNRGFLVQAKRYKGCINPTHAKDFIKIVNQRAYGGFFVHTGRTGRKAKAKLPRNIKIVSGTRLLELLAVAGWETIVNEKTLQGGSNGVDCG